MASEVYEGKMLHRHIISKCYKGQLFPEGVKITDTIIEGSPIGPESYQLSGSPRILVNDDPEGTVKYLMEAAGIDKNDDSTIVMRKYYEFMNGIKADEKPKNKETFSESCMNRNAVYDDHNGRIKLSEWMKDENMRKASQCKELSAGLFVLLNQLGQKANFVYCTADIPQSIANEGFEKKRLGHAFVQVNEPVEFAIDLGLGEVETLPEYIQSHNIQVDDWMNYISERLTE